METLSKVNEQKDNVLAPNTTLSLFETLARGIMEGGECQDSEVFKCVRPCFCIFVGFQVRSPFTVWSLTTMHQNTGPHDVNHYILGRRVWLRFGK